MAELSDPVAARTTAIARDKDSPQDTLMNAEYAPAVLAALALRAGKPADAVEMLRAAEPYELRDPTVAYQRGQAFLAAGKSTEAEAEFRKLIDNPGIDDPMTSLHALAHLNLARALKQQNKCIESRAEYAGFLDIWNSADADLPPLKQARTEMAQLPKR
jgi:tetratricopeptide (TPR) repeat protein